MKRLLFCIFNIIFSIKSSIVLEKAETTATLIIKKETKNAGIDFIKLKEDGWVFKYELTPSLHIFEKKDDTNTTIDDAYLQNIKRANNGQIENIELATLRVNAIQRDPEPVVAVEFINIQKDQSVFYDTSYNRANNKKKYDNYGMGISVAWKLGYSGKGIVIAVNDVGVDVDHPDLRRNINKSLSFNFVGGQDVYPERFRKHPETLSFTDHGTRCIGLIAASKRNSICTTGIAYRSTIAVLKIFEVNNVQGGRISFLSDTILRGLIYRPQEIDIYSNSWAINKPFASLTFSSEEVLSYGTKTGRKGLGSIYVFPVGHIADGYTNSKYTIAVNSIGVSGRVPGYAELCACTLTSAFGEGVHINSTTIITTSHSDEKCTRDFKGTSASATMVSAIIALALQANNNLAWRDVQHIVVKSSNHEGMYESELFKRNGAGLYYHPHFGFGLLNATTIVTLAKTWNHVPQQVTQTNSSSLIRRLRRHEHTHVSSASNLMKCSEECSSTCVNTIEHVEVQIGYMTPNEKNLKISLTSPSRTHSILMDRWQSNKGNVLRQEVSFLSVNFWGETPDGTWILNLHQHGHETETEHINRFGILLFSLSISGTQKRCIRRTTKRSYRSTMNTPIATNIVHVRNSDMITDFVTSTAINIAGSIYLLLNAYPAKCFAIRCIL